MVFLVAGTRFYGHQDRFLLGNQPWLVAHKMCHFMYCPVGFCCAETVIVPDKACNRKYISVDPHLEADCAPCLIDVCCYCSYSLCCVGNASPARAQQIAGALRAIGKGNLRVSAIGGGPVAAGPPRQSMRKPSRQAGAYQSLQDPPPGAPGPAHVAAASAPYAPPRSASISQPHRASGAARGSVPSLGLSLQDSHPPGSVFVAQVSPQTFGYVVGFRVGDRIASVDGMKVASSQQIYHHIQQTNQSGQWGTSKQQLRFQVERHGATGLLDIVVHA